MKYKLIPIVILSIFTFLSCSSVTVNYDYDEEQDFSTYHTFKWLAKNKKNPPNAMKDPLAKRKTKNAVSKRLRQKVFRFRKKGSQIFTLLFTQA